MKPPYYDSDLIQTLQLSGEYIGRSNQPEQRADWVLFLIDEIKSLLPEDEYVTLLNQLNSKVAALNDETSG